MQATYMRAPVLSLLLSGVLAAGISLSAYAQVPPPVVVDYFTKADTPDPVLPGGLLTYTITGDPDPDPDIFNVTLTDVIPAQTTFMFFTGPAGWTITTPPVGGTGTVTATNAAYIQDGIADIFTLGVAVNPTAFGVITNSATVLGVNVTDPLDDVTSIIATATTAVATTGVPEPSALALMAIGLAGLRFRRRKRIAN